jgi:hypothetical protein
VDGFVRRSITRKPKLPPVLASLTAQHSEEPTATMTDLPTELPFDVEHGGTAAKMDDVGPDVDATTTTTTTTTTTDTSSSSASDDLDIVPAGEIVAPAVQHQGRQGSERRPGNQGARSRDRSQGCCEWVADAVLATLAVTYLVTSVLVALSSLTMLIWVVLSAQFVLLWNCIAWSAREVDHRSAMASVPFFFFDMINLACLTRSEVPFWVLIGVWSAPFALLVLMGIALIAQAVAGALVRAALAAAAAATRSCGVACKKGRGRRSEDAGTGGEEENPSMQPSIVEEEELRLPPPYVA